MTTSVHERRVALLTAGIGSRLGTVTQKRNKGLIAINNKAVLGHLIDRLPAEAPIVVALGYYGDLIRQYLELAYPQRSFIFREVIPYDGPGSSSAYSLYCLRDLLPGPFLFCTNDTIVRQDLAFAGRNWVGMGVSDDIDKYTRFSLFGDRVTRVHRKGEPGGSIAYIGLAEIHDATAFWDGLGKALAQRGECSDVEGLFPLLDLGLYGKQVDWLDTGSKDQYDHAVRVLGGNHAQLPKEDEDLYFHGDRVIKFFSDAAKVEGRVQRARILKGLVPEIVGSRRNFYAYRWVDGIMLSQVTTPQLLRRFLEWAERRLWLPAPALSPEQAAALSRSFYRDKTLARLRSLYESGWVRDQEYVINGVPCQRPAALIDSLDEDFYSGSYVRQFHGDLHPDNVLVTGNGGDFVLLDWRENYAGLLDQGDVYYDLAKLYHGLLVAHDCVKAGDFRVEIQESVIGLDIPVHYRNLDAIAALESWVGSRGLSVPRLRVMTALIYLNIAPLHHYPYNQFLFFLGTQMLQRELVRPVMGRPDLGAAPPAHPGVTS